MLRHRVLVVLLVVLGPWGCDKAKTSPEAAVGDFPDNAMLAYVPADTPYVFATFKPISPEYIHKMTQAFGPIWHRAFDTYMAKSSDDAGKTKAIFDEIGELSAKRLDELGFSADTRMVVYGLPGGYPAMRFELASGDRVLAFVKRVGDRIGEQVPPPTQRGDWKVWRAGDPAKWGVVIAVASKQLVVAAAPTQALDAALPGLLGETKPTAPLTTKQMHEVAARDGFTGQGVGYVDVAKVAALASAKRPAECQTAIRGVAQRVPRIALGYRDLTTHETSAGVVVELAPDVAAQLRTVTGSLAGLDRMVADQPAMGVAVAGDLEHARALVPGLATVLGDLGQRCEALDVSVAADKLRELASQPLPPYLVGLHGGLLGIDHMVMTDGKPSQLDAYSLLSSDHAADLLKQLASLIPGLDVPLDGKAHALPPGAMPFPGHAGATQSTLAGAIGERSERKVVALLASKPAPAPLAMLVFDYQRIGQMIPIDPDDPSSADTQAVVRALGVAKIEVTADQRGLVAWMTFEML